MMNAMITRRINTLTTVAQVLDLVVVSESSGLEWREAVSGWSCSLASF